MTHLSSLIELEHFLTHPYYYPSHSPTQANLPPPPSPASSRASSTVSSPQSSSSSNMSSRFEKTVTCTVHVCITYAVHTAQHLVLERCRLICDASLPHILICKLSLYNYRRYSKMRHFRTIQPPRNAFVQLS